ncbi:hypothetical protein LSH36_3g01029 [Paralvinella palmiformis]|uniref:Cupin type-2 domain-containing protein n=1 Tax=Paralvinella palmiformis TaxID=53620 RepID=A0AAD9NHA9_9ANNE|nr:hypothetical protein LSH36_3g01029 [Paralvinella palmiformis]
MSESSLPVESWDDAKDGPLSIENMKKKLESQGYHCTQYEFGPGTVFPDHDHSITKKDAIVSGRVRFTMNNKTVIMKPGDMLEVPKGVVHNAAVVGNEPVVFFDSTYN